MEHEIKNHWVVHEPTQGHPISIRALKPKGSSLDLRPHNRTFHPCAFADLEEMKLAFESEALMLNQRGYNVYFIMNEIREDFKENIAVKDADISARTTLLIDIDRNGDTSCPADSEELQAAEELADRVERYLLGEGFPRPAWVESGNGMHLYFRLSAIPNTPDCTQALEAFLKGLANQLKHPLVGIDTTVFNASRITKVIGTVARKGQESEGREFRIARLR